MEINNSVRLGDERIKSGLQEKVFVIETFLQRKIGLDTSIWIVGQSACVGIEQKHFELCRRMKVDFGENHVCPDAAPAAPPRPVIG